MALQSASQSSTNYSALLSQVAALPVETQREIAAAAALFRGPDQQLVTQVNNVMSATPQQEQSLVGNDAMVATPQGMELADNRAIARTEQQQGRSSYDEHDLGLLKARVENRVKELMAAGKSRDEILAEIGMIGGANAELAQQIAQEQYEANKNPFEIPKSEQASSQQAEGALTIASLLGFAAAKEEPEQRQKPAMTPQEELAVAIWAPKPLFAQAEEPAKELSFEAKPLAQISGIGDVANMFKAALTNFEPSERQGNAGQAQERDGWVR